MVVSSPFSVWRYRVYGLSLVCDFELPELSPPLDETDGKDTPADIIIELGAFLFPDDVKRDFASGAMPGHGLTFGEQQSQLFFARVGRFTASEGRHILVEPLEGLRASTWRLPLLGAVLALLLEQRGLFVLHAGAVDMGGFAAAFLGDKGQGKSTLNAAMAVAGFPLFSDDAVALEWADAESDTFPTALCGFAQIKLVPDAVRAVLDTEPLDLDLVAPDVEEIDKRSFMAPLAMQPLPLRHLFVLTSLEEEVAEAGQEKIEVALAPIETPEGVILRVLAPQEALLHLIPHTFGCRFGDLYLQGERKITHFRACAHLVSRCQVWELSRRRDLALLPATVAAITRFAALAT